MINVTTLACEAGILAQGNGTTHHMVPRGSVLRCQYCGRTEATIRADAERVTEPSSAADLIARLREWASAVQFPLSQHLSEAAQMIESLTAAARQDGVRVVTYREAWHTAEAERDAALATIREALAVYDDGRRDDSEVISDVHAILSRALPGSEPADGVITVPESGLYRFEGGRAVRVDEPHESDPDGFRFLAPAPVEPEDHVCSICGDIHEKGADRG